MAKHKFELANQPIRIRKREHQKINEIATKYDLFISDVVELSLHILEQKTEKEIRSQIETLK